MQVKVMEPYKVLLYGLRFYGYHGVWPEEKKVGQWFEVDLEMWGDFTKAAQSDNLEEALDYSMVYKLVKNIMEGPGVNLLEKLASQIAGVLLEIDSIQKVLVRVKKPGAPLGGPLGYAGIEIVRSKNHG